MSGASGSLKMMSKSMDLFCVADDREDAAAGAVTSRDRTLC